MRYLASFSGGKDSAATIILAHEFHIPLDEVIYSQVMFSDTISGELPEHVNFIKNVAFPLFEEWGYKTVVVQAKTNYLKIFNRPVSRSLKPDRIGMQAGFPMAGKCSISRDCKIKPINDYIKRFGNEEIAQYIGIAVDETERLQRIGNNKRSLLAEFGYTEEMAMKKAEEYGLLSPCYSYSSRNGCWFCPNCGLQELMYLRNHYRELWNYILKLEERDGLVGKVWNTRNKMSIHEMERRLGG
ncbi:hypothetical protein AALB53_18000 [Lachnospiraceae bacterium 47-T17]